MRAPGPLAKRGTRQGEHRDRPPNPSHSSFSKGNGNGWLNRRQGVPPARGGPERARGLPRPTTAGDPSARRSCSRRRRRAGGACWASASRAVSAANKAPSWPMAGIRGGSGGRATPFKLRAGGDDAFGDASGAAAADRARARQLGGWAVRVESPAGPQGPRPRDRSPQSGPRTSRLLGPPGAQRIPLGARAGAHRGRRAPEALRYAAGPPSCLGPRGPLPALLGRGIPWG